MLPPLLVLCCLIGDLARRHLLDRGMRGADSLREIGAKDVGEGGRGGLAVPLAVLRRRSASPGSRGRTG
jgi:hypothetical protein